MTMQWKEGKWPKDKCTCYFTSGTKVRVELTAINEGYRFTVRYDYRLVASEDFTLRGEMALTNAKARAEKLFGDMQSEFANAKVDRLMEAIELAVDFLVRDAEFPQSRINDARTSLAAVLEREGR